MPKSREDFKKILHFSHFMTLVEEPVLQVIKFTISVISEPSLFIITIDLKKIFEDLCDKYSQPLAQEALPRWLLNLQIW